MTVKTSLKTKRHTTNDYSPKDQRVNTIIRSDTYPQFSSLIKFNEKPFLRSQSVPDNMNKNCQWERG